MGAPLELGASGAADAGPGTGPEAQRPAVAVVGISDAPVCGARDHAMLLTDALERQGLRCSTHWLERDAGAGMRASAREIGAWAGALPEQIARAGADAVLFHYSVFSYSHRGIPVYVPRVLRAIARSRLPVVTVLHEFAFPWRLDGARGKVWALSQRAALVAVMRTSAACVVTISDRARWLASRPWLARRPCAVTPVFSNLPDASGAGGGGPVLGMFGYSYGRPTARVILGALAIVREGGRDAALTLLGGPGPDSREGRVWREEARALGLEHALAFSGVLPAQALADALASCELLLFADLPGPTSRKTTLAASLASGRPLLALEGPHAWPELLRAQALRLAPRSPAALAQEIGRLLDDPAAAAQLAARGREFAQREMSTDASARVVAALIARVAPARHPEGAGAAAAL